MEENRKCKKNLYEIWEYKERDVHINTLNLRKIDILPAEVPT